jgi:hypothetical protein
MVNTIRFLEVHRFLPPPPPSSILPPTATNININRYGKHTVVNLIQNSGHEADLCAAFSHHIAALEGPTLRYVYFNFAKETKGMKFERLSILIDKLENDIQEQGSFISEQRGDVVQIHSFQQGVFRSNCIDCLDRTNVVQSMLARRALDLQLKR